MKKTIFILLAFAIAIIIAGCEYGTEPTNNEADNEREEAQRVAENWIRNAPTYSFDGSNLDLIEHLELESFPVQHKLTYTFMTANQGYGDRTGEIVLPATDQKTIIITIVEGEVVSAIIDGYWDELRQRPINIEESEISFTMQYQPMQCEQYAWDEWYVQGNVAFESEPTQSQLVTTYYLDVHGVVVQNFRTEEVHDAVCQACDVCPQTFVFFLDVKGDGVAALESEGWSIRNQI